MIDTHAHLDQLEDLPQSLEEARQAGVETIVAVSVDLSSCQRNLSIKESTRQPQIRLGMGIHPGNIRPEEIDSCLEFIRRHIERVDAIGEIGLDFWYKWVRKDQEKKEEQRRVFRRLLALAGEYDRPAVIHSRGTWRECFQTVRESEIQRAVFHWYSGPLDVLADILKAGYFVSTTPSLAYSPQSREAIANAPIEQTLIETDCPVFYREDGENGFSARPKHVFKTLQAYARLKGMEEEKAAAILTENAKRFFGIS